MNTDDLIAALAADAPAVSPHAVTYRVALSVLGGAAVALVLIVAMLGLRADLAMAAMGMHFWMKLLYCGAVGVIALGAALLLARPDAAAPRGLWLLAGPAALMTGAAAVELSVMSPAQRDTALMGDSWSSCSLLLVGFALPILAALLVAYRRFAPTRLRATGFTLGLAAGGFAAMLYCLHCPEMGMGFVLIWYSLGIGMAGAMGALVGPRLLRW